MQLKSTVTIPQLYYVALGLLTVSTAIIWRWMRSPYGLALTAVRDDEDAARYSGVDVNKIKSVVFQVSAALTGLASGLRSEERREGQDRKSERQSDKERRQLTKYT